MWWIPIPLIWAIETIVIGVCLAELGFIPELFGLLIARMCELFITLCAVLSMLRLFGQDTKIDKQFRRAQIAMLTILMTVSVVSIIGMAAVSPSNRVHNIVGWWQMGAWIKNIAAVHFYGLSPIWLNRGTYDIYLAWYHTRMGITTPFPEWCGYRCRSANSIMAYDQVRIDYQIPDEIWNRVRQLYPGVRRMPIVVGVLDDGDRNYHDLDQPGAAAP